MRPTTVHPSDGADVPPRRRRRLPVSDPDELLTALERLDERDRTVVKMRYGLAGERIHNLREIAKLLGISRERVRQLEARALEQLTELAVAAGVGEADAQLARSDATGIGSRRGLIRRWTLLLLAAGPAHVYELKKRFNELGIPQVTYRNLHEFEAEGLVSSDWAAARHGGPTRRIYTLTGDGAERLNTDRQLLEHTAHTLTEFLTRCDGDGDGNGSQARAAGQSTDAS